MSKLVLMLAAVAASCACAVDVTVVQVDGEEAKGALTDFTETGATVAGKLVAAKDIAQIKFPGTIKSKNTSPLVLLRNGDALSEVSILGGGDTKLKLKSDALGEFEIEYKLIDAIVFYWPLKLLPESLDAMLKGPPPKEDVLQTVKGEVITGFYEKLSDKELTFNAGGQSRAYAFDQVAAVRLAVAEKYEPNKALNLIVRLADRSRLTVKPAGMEKEGLKFDAVHGGTWAIEGSRIANAEYAGGRLVYLSTMTPSAVEQKPYVRGAPVVFTWRKDRSAANTALTIGDKTYEKGIGVHSYCKLTYALKGEYVKFMVDVGMDATAPAKAACAWKVLVDGKEGAAGTAKAGGEKTEVKLDVTGAKELELICDYGADDDDAGDRLDFVNARLIKP